MVRQILKGTFVAPSFPWLGVHFCVFMKIMMDGLRKDEHNFSRQPSFHARFEAGELVLTAKK